MMIRNKMITIDTIKEVMDHRPRCECANYSNQMCFDCVDCENVYAIINEFIRTAEFQEWLERRYSDGK